jgi:hypothetical protein
MTDGLNPELWKAHDEEMAEESFFSNQQSKCLSSIEQQPSQACYVSTSSEEYRRFYFK